MSANSDADAVEQEPFRKLTMNKRQIGFAMVGLMLAMLLAVLDQTIVSTALWTIVRDLDPANGLAHMSWLVTAYLLASTATQPLYGKMSDLYGRKKIFMLSIVLFLFGSALCGLSQNMMQLILFRGVQGLGAGGLMSLSMAIIGDMIPPNRRGKYSGLFALVFGIGSVFGPLIGGFLTDAHGFLGLTTNWRWVFYINLPLGILALAVIQKVLHLPKFKHKHHIDYFGAGLMMAGVSALLLVLEWGGSQYAWTSSTIIGMAAAGVALIAGFLYRERKADEPILSLHLFKNSVFRVGVPVLFIMGSALFGALIYISLYFQLVNGMTPTAAGLHLIPMTLGMMLATGVTGALISKHGRYKVFPIVGMAFVTIALTLLGMLTATTASWQLSAYLFLLGLGMGQVMQVITMAVQNAISPREMGAGTAATVFFRSLGGVIGSAVFGVILTNRLAANLPSGYSSGSSMPDTSVIHSLPIAVQHMIFEAFTKSTNTVFLCAAALTSVGFLLTFFLREMRLRNDNEHETMEEIAERSEIA
ncbi:MAG TPA: MDR family MFS transporter [Patescibacteria group bacterium]|nr:MDR family MFS transporter [Patescibacteria group bacterium]